MKVGLSNKQKIFITVFLSLVTLTIFIVVLNITIGKTVKKVKTENKSLQSQYDTLQVYLLNKDQYFEDTTKNVDTIVKLADTYNGKMSKVFVIHEFEELYKTYGMESTSLTISDAEYIDTTTFKSNMTSENDTIELNYYIIPISISYDMKYSELKKFIADILNMDRKIAIKSISIAHDDATGNITGTLSLTWASIDGYKDSIEPKYTEKTGIKALFSDEAVVEDLKNEEANLTDEETESDEETTE